MLVFLSKLLGYIGNSGILFELITWVRHVHDVGKVNLVQTSSGLLLQIDAIEVRLLPSSIALPPKNLFPLLKHRFHKSFNFLDHNTVHSLWFLQLGDSLL